MVRRGSILLIAFTILNTWCFAQMMGVPNLRDRDNSLSGRFSAGNASLEGTVVDALSNKPLQNARVELRDATNGTVVSSAYTNSGGAFDFGTVQQGLYQIVAVLGISQVEERVDVNAFRTSVSLRMPTNNSPEAGNTGNTVSVAQYKIPEKARNEFQKAQQASASMNRDEAKKHVARALEAFPNYADALTLRAILNLSGNVGAAVADLQKAIQCDGNYALAYTVLGSALNMQEKFDQALQTLQRGQSLAPDSWQSYFEMARAYLGKMDYQTALRQLDHAQSLVQVEYPPMRLVKAQALLGLRQYEAAVSELQTYLQKDPSGPNSATAEQLLNHARELMARK